MHVWMECEGEGFLLCPALVTHSLSSSGTFLRSWAVCQVSSSALCPFHHTWHNNFLLFRFSPTIFSTSYSSVLLSKSCRLASHGQCGSGLRWYLVKCCMFTTLCIGYMSRSLSLYAVGLITWVISKGPIFCWTSLRPLPQTPSQSSYSGRGLWTNMLSSAWWTNIVAT